MSQQNYTNAIARSVSDGWTLTTQTDTTASLTKRQKFSWGWFILWFILGILPSVGYVIYWAARPPQQLFIELTASGEVRTTNG